MGIPYIKVEAEVAVRILDELVVQGYKLKDNINSAYRDDPNMTPQSMVHWHWRVIEWSTHCWMELKGIFVSQKELFEFRDAPSPFDKNSGNLSVRSAMWNCSIKTIEGHTSKLMEYDRYIREHCEIKVEIVHGDKITQKGTRNSIEVNKRS